MWSKTFKTYVILLVVSFDLQKVKSKVFDTTNSIKSSMAKLVTKFERDFIETEEKTIEEIRQHWHDPENKELDQNIRQIVHKYGYEFEEHEIETKDGYIITLHRIPSIGKAVLLVHGILLNSDAWILNGRENGLPFLLADKGYDVWMTNARGSTHSRKHKYLMPDSEKYWDFSFDEIGRYDHPAAIDYILNLKSDKQLNYIGFSQGTTTFFIMCSELPEYNKKINLMISLSTISYLSNLYSPALRFMLKTNAFSLVTFNKYNLLPHSKVYQKLCSSFSISKFFCANFFYAVFGYDLGQLNVTNIPLIFRHIPAGASIKQLKHYEQLIYSKKFTRYDYGRKVNLHKYGSVKPPKYNVKKITALIAMFHSNYDWFSNITDVIKLRDKLSNLVYFRVVNGSLNHIDYIFGKDVRQLVYLPILQLFDKFS